jgi:hypothetical protein
VEATFCGHARSGACYQSDPRHHQYILRQSCWGTLLASRLPWVGHLSRQASVIIYHAQPPPRSCLNALAMDRSGRAGMLTGVHPRCHPARDSTRTGLWRVTGSHSGGAKRAVFGSPGPMMASAAVQPYCGAEL